MFHGHLDYFKKPPLDGRPNTKPWDHGTLLAHNRWFILFDRVWGPAWIENPWNNIWLRDWSRMTSHYTWGSVTTLHDFKGVLGRPLDTFFGLPQFHGHVSWLVCEVAPQQGNTQGATIYTLNVVFSVIWYFMSLSWLFQMTLLMNNLTNIVVDDGWVHPLAKTLPPLCQ